MLSFNPRAREGRDYRLYGLDYCDAGVSTHAPAKGATLYITCLYKRLAVVSTHAPAKGATGQALEGALTHIVSTHAPAKGATCKPYV